MVDIKYSVIRDNSLLKAATKLVHLIAQDIEATIAMASDIKVTAAIVVPSYRKATEVEPYRMIVMEVQYFHKATGVVIVKEAGVDCKVVMLPIKLVGTQLQKDQSSTKGIQIVDQINQMVVITRVVTNIINTAEVRMVVISHRVVKVRIIVVP